MGNNYICGRGWKSLEGEKSEGEGSVGKSTYHISLTTWVQYSEFTFFKSQLWWCVHICIPGTPTARWAAQTWKSAVNSFTQHSGKTRETLLQNQVEGENPLPRNCALTPTCVPWQVNTHPCAKTHTHTKSSNQLIKYLQLEEHQDHEESTGGRIKQREVFLDKWFSREFFLLILR